MREACERIHAAIAAGKRICVHGDYDADGICATALALLVLRELGADVALAPAQPFRRGLRRSGRDGRRLAEEGYGLLLTVDCGITAVEAVEEANAARPRGRHHRPPPARASGCPTARRRHQAVRLPLPGALRDRRRAQARPGAARERLRALARPRRHRRPRDDRRRRPAGRREPRRSRSKGCGGSPRPRSRACAR